MVINGVDLSREALDFHKMVFAICKKRKYCFYTNDTLAKMSDRSYWTVSHYITKLERAGLLARVNVYEKGTKKVIGRKLIAIDRQKDDPKAKAEIEHLKADSTEEGNRARLRRNARMLGIVSNSKINEAIEQYGEKRVDEVLAMIKASTTICNVYGFFYAALKKGYTLGKRAMEWVGKVYEARKYYIGAYHKKKEQVKTTVKKAKNEYERVLAGMPNSPIKLEEEEVSKTVVRPDHMQDIQEAREKERQDKQPKDEPISDALRHGKFPAIGSRMALA